MAHVPSSTPQGGRGRAGHPGVGPRASGEDSACTVPGASFVASEQQGEKEEQEKEEGQQEEEKESPPLFS